MRSERFRWTAGQDLIGRYEAPILHEAPALMRCFCKVCGSPVPVERADHDWVTLMAGVLDADPGSGPFRRIFVAQAPAWLEMGDELPEFSGRPPAAERLQTKRPER